jgi:hypothetical protein
MKARRALLKKLAAITDWDTAKRAALDGEAWLETRNTTYRFRDGVCFAVACRDPKKNERAGVLVGMRLVGWLCSSAGSVRFSFAWEAGAAAVLWRAQVDGVEGSEEAMAMTSPTTLFTRGKSPASLQALHDARPPEDSSTFHRAGPSRFLDAPRPRMPSKWTQSS